MKTTVKDFDSCLSALDFIEELKVKNKKCVGLLNNTPKKGSGKEYEYIWHVTYNADMLEDLSK